MLGGGLIKSKPVVARKYGDGLSRVSGLAAGAALKLTPAAQLRGRPYLELPSSPPLNFFGQLQIRFPIVLARAASTITYWPASKKRLLSPSSLYSMTNFNEIVANVPQPVQLALAGVGALYLGSHVLGYLRFLLNIFVLSGNNVSHHSLRNRLGRRRNCTDVIYSSVNMARRAPGLLSLAHLMASAKNTRHSWPPRASTSSSFPAPSQNSRRSPPNSSRRTPVYRQRSWPWTSAPTETKTTSP